MKISELIKRLRIFKEITVTVNVVVYVRLMIYGMMILNTFQNC